MSIPLWACCMLGKAFRTTWAWLTMIEAILGLIYAFIPPPLFILLIAAPIMYVLVVLLLSLPRIT